MTAVPSRQADPARGGPLKTEKGGGEKWLIMATAMDAALDRMRILYLTLDRARTVSREDQIIFHPIEAQAILGEVAAVANILKSGLKARSHT